LRMAEQLSDHLNGHSGIVQLSALV